MRVWVLWVKGQFEFECVFVYVGGRMYGWQLQYHPLPVVFIVAFLLGYVPICIVSYLFWYYCVSIYRYLFRILYCICNGIQALPYIRVSWVM